MKRGIRRYRPVKASRKKIGQAKAQKMFVQWMQYNEPFLYRVARRRGQLLAKNNLGGMGALDWKGLFKSAVSTVKDVAPGLIQARQQKKIMDMQLKRAEQGLPPANIIDYTPAIKIAPEITPQTEEVINRLAQKSIGAGFKKIAIPIAVGLGALILLKRRR